MSRHDDLTIRATRRRLESLGYAPTSATHPDRIVDTRFHHPGRPASFTEIAEHPAAILCNPNPEIGCELDDAAQRQIVLLTVTAYLLADARQSKAVFSVLEGFKLTSGPYLLKSFGDRVYPLQYNGKESLHCARARLAYDDDDRTVIFEQTTAPTDYEMRQTIEGFPVRVVRSYGDSHILPLDGAQWKNGHVLDIPRRDLPELFADDLRDIISEVEAARWGARPLAVAKEQAA